MLSETRVKINLPFIAVVLAFLEINQTLDELITILKNK
jgi:hypothetical protein